MIPGGKDTLAQWISAHKNQPEVGSLIELFDLNEQRLFVKNPAERPDFELAVPDGMTKQTYTRVVKKIFAVMRHLIYKEIRAIVRSRPISKDSPMQYVTKNETREILHNLNVQQIREQVFGLLLTPGKASEGESNLIDTMAPQTKVTE